MGFEEIWESRKSLKTAGISGGDWRAGKGGKHGFLYELYGPELLIDAQLGHFCLFIRRARTSQEKVGIEKHFKCEKMDT